MRATLTSVIDGNESTYEVERETIGELHEYAQAACRAGLIAAITMMQITGQPPKVSLEKAYEAGMYIPYRLEFSDGTPTEEGITDISPSALGKHHLRTIKNKPELKELMISHGDSCDNDACEVRELFEAFDLSFPLPLDD